MTQQTYKQEPMETVAQKLFYKFSTQLGRMSTSVDVLENFGHKIANTNFPKDSDNVKMAALVQSEGMLSELERSVNQFETYNIRLEELVKKLSELI